jgi:hypothetical protein
MVIFIVDYFCIATFELERHAPVGLYCYSPGILLLTFQPVNKGEEPAIIPSYEVLAT